MRFSMQESIWNVCPAPLGCRPQSMTCSMLAQRRGLRNGSSKAPLTPSQIHPSSTRQGEQWPSGCERRKRLVMGRQSFLQQVVNVLLGHGLRRLPLSLDSDLNVNGPGGRGEATWSFSNVI